MHRQGAMTVNGRVGLAAPTMTVPRITIVEGSKGAGGRSFPRSVILEGTSNVAASIEI